MRGTLARWLDFLADFRHHNIVYQPGATNVVTDALSRCSVYEQNPQRASSKVLSLSSLPPTAPQQSCIPASNPPEPAVRASPFLVRAKVGRRHRLQIESTPNSGPSHESPSPLLHDNVLASPQSSLSDPEMQVVGDQAWEAAIQRCSKFSAAYKRAKERQPEPVLIPDLGRFKLVDRLLCTQLQGLWRICVPRFPQFPWSSISFDFIGGLPLSGDGCDSTLTVVDSLNKMAHIIPTKPSLCTSDFVRFFANRVVRYHGLPTTTVSDQDQRFVSEFWRLFCRHFGIKRALSSAWHPQTDGQTEPANRTIEQMLPTYIQSREEWPDLLLALELAYNCTSHSASGISPFEVMLGEDPLRPQDLDLRPRPPDMATPPECEPIAKVSDGLPIYEVGSILDQQGDGDAARYLVKWKGFPDSDATLEPLSNLDNCAALLRSFRASRKARPSSSGASCAPPAECDCFIADSLTRLAHER
ncbi:hypothetical protein Esti_002925 [Eimeria stiedai]